jgi:hypothetical protein
MIFKNYVKENGSQKRELKRKNNFEDQIKKIFFLKKRK